MFDLCSADSGTRLTLMTINDPHLTDARLIDLLSTDIDVIRLTPYLRSADFDGDRLTVDFRSADRLTLD